MFGPKESDKVYFHAFAEHARKSVVAAKEIVKLLEDPATDPESRAAAVKEKEHHGDELTHATMRALHETWITPLDRYDIHALMSRLDDVLDAMEATAERVVLFEIKVPSELGVKMAQVNVKVCEEIAKAMALLPTLAQSGQEALACVREINRLESESDFLFRRALGELFKGSDAMMALKWREIYDFLENTADAGEEVANVLEGIVLEYA